MNQTPEEFENDFLEMVKDHKLTIINDDGINRHIRFKNPSTTNCYFDLITWKGHLAISGDLGTWVFSRLDDMFCFFRDEKGELNVNPSYWAEKLVAMSRFGSSEDNTHNELDVESTIKNIGTLLHSNLSDIYGDCPDCSENILINKSLCTGCSDRVDEIRVELFACDSIREIQDFCEEHGIPDWYEYSCQYNPTHNFLLCLYAIAWGVIQYDKHKGLENDRLQQSTT